MIDSSVDCPTETVPYGRVPYRASTLSSTMQYCIVLTGCKVENGFFENGESVFGGLV